MAEDLERDDKAIVHLVLQGDVQAYRLLIERHEQRVLYAVKRILKNEEDVKDITQEAFVKGYTHLKSYNEQWCFSTWIVTIATRMALNALRKNKLRTTTDSQELSEYLATNPADGPREQFMRKQWKEKLRVEIDKLNDKMRLIFGLRHVDGLSIQEIAQTLDETPSAVKVTLFRTRKILKEKMKGSS